MGSCVLVHPILCNSSGFFKQSHINGFELLTRVLDHADTYAANRSYSWGLVIEACTNDAQAEQ